MSNALFCVAVEWYTRSLLSLAAPLGVAKLHGELAPLSRPNVADLVVL